MSDMMILPGGRGGVLNRSSTLQRFDEIHAIFISAFEEATKIPLKDDHCQNLVYDYQESCQLSACVIHHHWIQGPAPTCVVIATIKIIFF